MKYLRLLTLISCAFTSGWFTENVHAQGAFIEYNGRLVMEAESTTLNGHWEHATQYNGYTGQDYIFFNTPATNFNSGATDQTIEYKFIINNPGTYRIKIRNFIPDDNPTEHNDVFLKVDNGNAFKSFSHTNWQWNFNFLHDDGSENFFEPDYDLTAGEHTLYLVGRSANFGLDRIHIYQVGTSNALDHTSDESPRESNETVLFASPTKVSLVMNTGDNTSVSPQNPSISINNPGTGTLTNVTAIENSDWLDLNFIDNEGNDQTLNLVVNNTANALATGNYTATIEINADNAEPVSINVSLFIHDGCYYLDEFNTLNEQYLGGQNGFSYTGDNAYLNITSAGHDQWDYMTIDFNNGASSYTVDVTEKGATPVIKFDAKASSNVLLRATIVDDQGAEAQNATLSGLNNLELTTQWKTYTVDLEGYMWDEWTGGGTLDQSQLKSILFRINPGYTEYPHTGVNGTYDAPFTGTIEINALGFGNCILDVVTGHHETYQVDHAAPYPNPFSTASNIALTHNSTVSLYTISGEIISKQVFKSGTHLIGSTLNEGTYIVIVEDENRGVSYRKITKL